MTSFPTFRDFFLALWPHYQEYGPFPWQTTLAERLAVGQWPQALDLPTAAGKTACIDAAVYALACQADKPVTERTAPRRIWFVVDRRIVVDEAFERASTIAEKLADAKDGPLKHVAERLLKLSGTKRPLAVARLRGGILRGDNWGRVPSQPAVITSTVDQLGSRLLFRGYGRSNLTAPIFAGLAVHDSLILLDEAHCSVPFMQTLRAVETFRGAAWAEAPIVTPFAFAILSATPPPDIPRDTIFPGADRARALDHPVLGERMSASKPADLVTPLRTKEQEGDDPLVIKAAGIARSYVEKHEKRRVAVIVNRVNTARAIAGILHNQAGETADVILLTGRIRPYERDRLVEAWKPFLKAVSPEQPEKPIILVSTQCIEVGADFSFDALVTEAASLDALRQRFGRLNRMGAPGPAPATILVRDRDAKEGQSDPIYGTAISECWSLITKKATGTSKGNGEGSIDFGIDALDDILNDVDAEDLEKCLAPRPDAPVLLPAHLDLLCQTAPAPAIEPDVRLFLHGKQRGVSEARIVWRTDLAAGNPQVWKEIVALCPPISGEMLAVPLHRLRVWLADEDTSDDDTSDVESVGGDDGITNTDGDTVTRRRRFLIWRGRDRSEVTDRPADVRPNDVVMVPAEYGIATLGQSVPAEALGKERLDLWEFALKAGGKPSALRLHNAVLAPWHDCPPIKDMIDLIEDPGWERESLQEAIEAILTYRPAGDDEPTRPPEWLCDRFGAVRNGRIEDHPAGGVVLFARQSPHDRDAELDLFADDDDLSSASGREILIADHTASVERAVGNIVSRCLPHEFLDPMLCAARWHDVGKLDERFQLLLREGNEIASDLGKPLAKSAFVPTLPTRRDAIRVAAGLPKGFRHEMLSFQLTERHAGLPVGEQAADLVLHLVASHHGHGRPFAPVILDSKPPALSGHHDGTVIALDAAERAQLVEPHSINSGISDRFWRLTRRYGWWGVAYLEAMLRLGDWYGSEHVVGADQSPGSAPSVSRQRAEAVTAIAPHDALVMSGLDGANPLGFLAALGTLLVLRQGICPQARLSWRRAATWQPILTGVSATGETALCDAIASALRGRPVLGDAEDKRRKAQIQFDAIKKALKDKREEIKKAGLRGKERKGAIETEVAPLEREARRRRELWLDALKGAVPRPELALGQRIDCTDEEFRESAVSFIQNSRIAGREPLEFLAAFASDASIEGKDHRVVATPFCFITGSGHQFFLDTVRQLMSKVAVERLQSALLQPWSYTDKGLSLRWDPKEAARYALMDMDPGPLGAYTVWMANLLAYRALALFPSAPGRGGLETTSWRETSESVERRKDARRRGKEPGSWREMEFTWPLWEHSAGPDTIRSQMLLPELRSDIPNRPVLQAQGVVAIFRSRRIKVGSGANFKINFEPARGV